MVGCIKTPLGKEVGLGPGHIVLDGDPAPHSSPSSLLAHAYVAKRSPISATAELLLLMQWLWLKWRFKWKLIATWS